MLVSWCVVRLAIAPLLLFLPLFVPNTALVASSALAQETTPQDRKTMVDQLYEEGNRLINEGRYQEAIETLQRALEIYRQLGDRQGEGNTLNSIGGAYGGLGECPEQLTYFQQSLIIQREVGNYQMEGLVLNHVGAAHVCLGQYLQALEIYQQALAISRQVDNLSNEVLILNNIGSIYDITGQYSEALEVYNQASLIYNTIGEVPERQIALNRYLTGRIHNRLKQYEEATGALEQALALYRQLDDRGMERHVLQEFGRLYDNLEQYQTAREYYQKTLVMSREGNIRGAEAGALSDIGFTLEKEGQTELAVIFYKQSVNITEVIRRDYQVLSPEQQESYAETIADTYHRLANLLLQQNRVLEAQQVLDLLKIQELDDYLGNVRGSDRPIQSLEYLQPEQRILDLYNQAIMQGQELMQLRQIPEGDRTLAQQQRLAQLVANQQNLVQSFDDFLNRPDVSDAVNQLSRTARRQNIDLEQLNALQDNLRRFNQNAVLLYPLIPQWCRKVLKGLPCRES